MVSSRALYLGLLGLVAVERLVEVAVSRRNARRAFARGGRETGQRHFAAMVAAHTAFLPACAAEVVLARRRFPGALGWAALGGALAAQGLRYWVVGTLGERWNVRIIVVPGEPPVTGGPYRFVRHPNYVAVALEAACLPLVHGAWVTALAFSAVNAAILAVRVRAEEEALGEPWAQAFTALPRFVPERGERADSRAGGSGA
jgi:methyltransferase